MMNHTLRKPFKINPGTIITGKWHSNKYTILKELGYGANGIVYLARAHNQDVALKMSANGLSITSEVNVLKSFAKVQGSALGPSLLDVDDWLAEKGQISFYVMEYIKGPDLLRFISEKGNSWATVLLLQLLNDLDELHTNGWVFGDLKPENLIVMGPPPRIRCIDVGGTTIQGRAIKEFTEFFDRGYWGLGSRRAEPSYDLFAVAMIIINTYYPIRFPKSTGGIAQLKEAIRKQPELKKVEKVLLRALEGQYRSAKQMRAELLESFSEKERAPAFVQKTTTAPSPPSKQKVIQTQPISRQTYRKKKKKQGWFETLFIMAAMGILLIVGIWITTQ